MKDGNKELNQKVNKKLVLLINFTGNKGSTREVEWVRPMMLKHCQVNTFLNYKTFTQGYQECFGAAWRKEIKVLLFLFWNYLTEIQVTLQFSALFYSHLLLHLFVVQNGIPWLKLACSCVYVFFISVIFCCMTSLCVCVWFLCIWLVWQSMPKKELCFVFIKQDRRNHIKKDHNILRKSWTVSQGTKPFTQISISKWLFPNFREDFTKLL